MTEIDFLMTHGTNTSKRLIPDILKAIGDKLSEGITIGDLEYKVRPLCEPKERDGEYSLLFDIKDIGGFDHIEFKIKQTGWGK